MIFEPSICCCCFQWAISYHDFDFKNHRDLDYGGLDVWFGHITQHGQVVILFSVCFSRLCFPSSCTSDFWVENHQAVLEIQIEWQKFVPDLGRWFSGKVNSSRPPDWSVSDKRAASDLPALAWDAGWREAAQVIDAGLPKTLQKGGSAAWSNMTYVPWLSMTKRLVNVPFLGFNMVNSGIFWTWYPQELGDVKN